MTQKSIVPLEEVPQKLLGEYLQKATNYFRARGAAAVDWKYFDEKFNRGRTRGYAWVRGGRVRGFIGLIPAQIVRDNDVKPFNWTCDWGLENPKSTPGMGVLLLKNAIGSIGYAATIGGNRNTQALVPRIAARTVESAGLTFWRPLRMSALLHLASSRLPPLGCLASTLLGRAPLPWRVRLTRAPVRIADGVSARLDALFAAQRPREWTVCYDVPFLQWALERCPEIACGSCYIEGDRAPPAGALSWWHTAPTAVRHVRFSLWSQPGARGAADAVVAQVIRSARSQQAALVSTIVGKWDGELIASLRRAGFFLRPATHPLYLFSADLEPLRGVSYFAADLAQRFRLTAHD